MNTPVVPLEDAAPSPAGAIESLRIQSEILLNRAERVLKRIEARRLLAKPLWVELTVPGATVIVALVSFLGTFAASYVKGWYDLELTRQKYDSDLVLKAVVSDAKQSRENIRFLLEAGLLKDVDGKLAKAVADPSLSIRLASQASVDLQQNFSVGQMQILVEEIKKVTGTGIAIGLRVIEGTEPNAWAADLGGSFEIAYTRGFVDSMRRKSGTNWVAYAIVAHEMAHIVLGHFERSARAGTQQKQLELEADKWAGTALAKLGASLPEATVIHSALPAAPGGIDYPSSEERRAAIASGWTSVKSTQTLKR